MLIFPRQLREIQEKRIHRRCGGWHKLTSLFRFFQSRHESILYTYNGTYNVLLLSKFVELIETIGGGGGHSYKLVGNMGVLYPNEISSLDHFDFVRWYIDEEVSLDSTEEAENLVEWGCKVSPVELQ